MATRPNTFDKKKLLLVSGASLTALLCAGFITQHFVLASTSPTIVHNPYVMVEFSHSPNGTSQPMVLSPSGRILVNSQGEILNSAAGPVGSYTQTDGLQEAVNYATAKGEDVYIEGGSAVGHSNNNVYFLNRTLVIPPEQDFRIDGGEAVINYNPSTGNAIDINSSEDCHYRFGVIVTGATHGKAINFNPTEPTPVDHLVVITDSSFRFSSIATSKPIGTSASGIYFNASSGPILWNHIFATAVVGFQNNVVAQSKNSTDAVTFNRITVGHNHQASQAVGVISPFSVGNMWNLNDDRNGTHSVGIIDEAENNTFVIQSSGFPSGENILFKSGAIGNVVIGIGPVSVTDNNPPGKNRVITGYPGVGNPGNA